MRCLVIADEEYPAVASPVDEPIDLLISCGDLPDHYILSVAAQYGVKTIFAVKGNHDTASTFPPPIVDLHGCTGEWGRLRFGGFGGCQRYKPRGHHLYDQQEVEAALQGFPAVDVFVAHNSPKGIHDDAVDEAHEGFHAFNAYLERHRPSLFLHGHQHRDVTTQKGGSRIVGVYGLKVIELPGRRLPP